MDPVLAVRMVRVTGVRDGARKGCLKVPRPARQHRKVLCVYGAARCHGERMDLQDSQGTELPTIDADDTAVEVVETERSPGDLVAEIERHHAAFERKAGEAMDEALACGARLIEAKRWAGRGNWMQWVEHNLSFSYEKATLYMRFARNPQRVAGLSICVAARELAAGSSAEVDRVALVAVSYRTEWEDFSACAAAMIAVRDRRLCGK